MRLTHRAGSCDNGPCPNVFDTDDGDLVAIQGAELLDPNALAQLSQMPAHETVVLVPRALSEYLRYELVGYVESQAAGEQIGIADRAADASLSTLGEDFWLFDSESPDAYAVLMHYDATGHFVGFDHTVDPGVLDRCRRQRDIVRRQSVGLNTYLAARKADVVPE